MKIPNQHVDPVLQALSSVLSGVMLPISDACEWADAIVSLSGAKSKLDLVEKPIFAGRHEIDSNDDPDAAARLQELRNQECGVDIPVLELNVIADGKGSANPMHLALLLDLGVIEKEGKDSAQPEPATG